MSGLPLLLYPFSAFIAPRAPASASTACAWFWGSFHGCLPSSSPHRGVEEGRRRPILPAAHLSAWRRRRASYFLPPFFWPEVPAAAGGKGGRKHRLECDDKTSPLQVPKYTAAGIFVAYESKKVLSGRTTYYLAKIVLNRVRLSPCVHMPPFPPLLRGRKMGLILRSFVAPRKVRAGPS